MRRRPSGEEDESTGKARQQRKQGVTLISFSVPPIANCASPAVRRLPGIAARVATYIPAGEMPYPVIHSFPSAA